MKNNITNKGISIIVCCYNSAKRLPETLKHLSKQEFPDSLSMEIILVDNLSTDSTAVIANSLWNYYGNHRINFKVVEEKKAGLTNARNKGVDEASFDYLLFCDDDNWLSPKYATELYNILYHHPQVAACGGEGIPYFEIDAPDWFATYQESFAIGKQDITMENGKILNLYGAGMAIDKRKIIELRSKGFVPYLQDRVGNNLSSAGDTELTYALVLLGYDLYFAKELSFQHFMSKERLNINYLKKLFSSFGNDGPIRNLYYSYLSNRLIHNKIKNWNIHLALSLTRFVKYLIVPPKKNGRAIYLTWNISYIKSLFKIRTTYSQLKANIELIKTPANGISHRDRRLPVEFVEMHINQVK